MSGRHFEDILAETGTLCYTNVGVSMLPLIREGRDVIVIKRRTEARLKKYDVVLFKRPGVSGRGTYVLHRVLKVKPNGTYWIVGDNCTSGETVREENVIGVLTDVVRGGRSLTDGIGYWLYVHTWAACWPVRFLLLRLYGSVKRLLRHFKCMGK